MSVDRGAVARWRRAESRRASPSCETHMTVYAARPAHARCAGRLTTRTRLPPWRGDVRVLILQPPSYPRPRASSKPRRGEYYHARKLACHFFVRVVYLGHATRVHLRARFACGVRTGTSGQQQTAGLSCVQSGGDHSLGWARHLCAQPVSGPSARLAHGEEDHGWIGRVYVHELRLQAVVALT